jgi:hypothetical protein
MYILPFLLSSDVHISDLHIFIVKAVVPPTFNKNDLNDGMLHKNVLEVDK